VVVCVVGAAQSSAGQDRARDCGGSEATEPDLSVSFGVTADEAVVDALSTSCGMPRESILPALSALGLACWSAHQADEHGEDNDDAEDEDDDADDADE